MFTSASYVRNAFIFVHAAYVHEYHCERTAACSSTRASRLFIVFVVGTYICQFCIDFDSIVDALFIVDFVVFALLWVPRV